MPTLESHILISESTEGRHLVANPYFHQVDTAGNQLPYINEQDEVYINENEVRILKLINGEADYKAQSLTLPSAPLLLENQEKNRSHDDPDDQAHHEGVGEEHAQGHDGRDARGQEHLCTLALTPYKTLQQGSIRQNQGDQLGQRRVVFIPEHDTDASQRAGDSRATVSQDWQP